MSFLEDDKNTYSTHFTNYLQGDVYRDTYKAEKDIKIASYERTLSNVLDQIGDKKIGDIMTESDLTWETKVSSGYLARTALNHIKDVPLKEFYTKMGEPVDKDPIVRDLAENYVRIGTRVLNKSLYGDAGLRDRTISELKKQGFDAMVDIEDAFGYSALPIITFDDNKFKKIKQEQLR